MIKFVIDYEGQVQVPVVPAVEDQHIAEAVLSAVRQWRYTVPKFENKAVAVELTRELVLADATP